MRAISSEKNIGVLSGWLERNEYAYAHNRITSLGVPDFLIGLAIGLAIEFKCEGNRLSALQEAWRARYIARGGLYFIASSYQEAVEIVQRYEGRS